MNKQEKNRNIQAVIFDVGSVLVREEDKGPRERAARELGLTYDELVRAVFGHPLDRAALVGEVTTAELWNGIAETLGLTQAQITRLYAEFFGGNRMDYDLVAYIRTLKERYRTAILSNAFDDLRPLLQHHWRVADAFDVIVISAEEGCAKPGPEIYEITLRKLDVPAGEAVFIDDREDNIETARALGMHGIVFKTPKQATMDLENLLT